MARRVATRAFMEVKIWVWEELGEATEKDFQLASNHQTVLVRRQGPVSAELAGPTAYPISR